MFRYARLKHDFQLEQYGFKRRHNALVVTPETVVFNDQPKPGKGRALRLTQEWYDFVRAVNTERGFGLATGPRTGWVNEGWNGRDTPLVQSLSMGGNVVIVREISEIEFARLRAFNGEEPPPDPAQVNYLETPQQVQKFSCISDQEKIRNPGNGIDCYFPLIGAGELWVPLSRIELFPELPRKIQMTVTAFFRSSPVKSYFNVRGALAKGQTVTLLGYATKGSSVWGYVSTAAGKYGYVALLWYPKPDSMQFLTTWEMQTVPPLPPKP
jgi:hypothetical protein